MSSPDAGMGPASGDVWDTGFAKLHCQDFDYYIHYYEIILGRDTKKEKVDLDLTVVGGAKDISRRHARIYYDFKHHTFALEVLGKNGCYVQGELYLPGDDPVKLDSKDLIQIGGTEFYFLQAADSIDKAVAALGTPQSFSFRSITYHFDPVTGSVAHTLIPFPSQPMAATAFAHHTPIQSQPMAATASAKHTNTPSQPMPATTVQHTPIQSQPMAATTSSQLTHTPAQSMSAIVSAQHTPIASQPMSSSSMHRIHDFSALRLRDYFSKALLAYENSHGCANGDSGTIISTGTQGEFTKQSNRSLVELDLNDEPTETLSEDAENAHGCATGDGGFITGTGTQGPNTEQNNRSFGELDLNIEPIGTLDEEDNGHGLGNGEGGTIVGTGTQGTVIQQINRSLGELGLNVGLIGTPSEPVKNVEIRTDKDTDNPKLWQKEENDLMSCVASILSNHSSPTGWVPAAEVHAELVKRFSRIWPSSMVQKYLASEAGSSSGAVEKPWHKLLELLRTCPEKFVICSISRGTETLEFIGFMRP
ncbi:unnamed protein product [Alopecurus aequalis]